ncbi:MAG: hypothetical protein JRD05_05340 [Deltaproteobacteria bacterium]|nr:hypothetical protein [Deltaproteobacteria bacterium]
MSASGGSNIERPTSNNDVARAAQALAPRAAPQIILKSNKKTNTERLTTISVSSSLSIQHSMLDVRSGFANAMPRHVFDVYCFSVNLPLSIRHKNNLALMSLNSLPPEEEKSNFLQDHQP